AGVGRTGEVVARPGGLQAQCHSDGYRVPTAGRRGASLPGHVPHEHGLHGGRGCSCRTILLDEGELQARLEGAVITRELGALTAPAPLHSDRRSTTVSGHLPIDNVEPAGAFVQLYLE